MDFEATSVKSEFFIPLKIIIEIFILEKFMKY